MFFKTADCDIKTWRKYDNSGHIHKRNKKWVYNIEITFKIHDSNIYIFVGILTDSRILTIVANLFIPVMSIFGLPGEASLTILIGYFVSMSGSLGTIIAFDLTEVQATTLAIMVSTAHNLFAESAIIKKIGVSALLSSSVRIFFSLLCGFLYYRIFG